VQVTWTAREEEGKTEYTHKKYMLLGKGYNDLSQEWFSTRDVEIRVICGNSS
jgi:hypothetical protein